MVKICFKVFFFIFKDAETHIVEIRIKVKNGCPNIEELLTGILGDFVWKLDYAYFTSKLDNFQKISLVHATTICQRIMDGIERSNDYDSFENIMLETKSLFLSTTVMLKSRQ